MAELYDTIGHGYRRLRQPDPRIEAAIRDALGGAARIVNVGAGAGSYEPTDRRVVAVEPSSTMIAQRPRGAAPVVRASAEALPFADASFDAGLAILTMHHWPDQRRGLDELRRAARDRIVVFTWDPDEFDFWLSDYFPEIWVMDREIFPTIELIRRQIGPVELRPLPIPHDCTDGFLGAYWRRPAAYLNPDVRAAISAFAKLPNPEPGLARLRADLASGEWHRKHGAVLKQSSVDMGYRLVVARA